MSSDGNSPDTTWQRSRNADWGQPLEHVHHIDHDALPPTPALEDEEAYYSDMPASAQMMSPVDDEEDMADQFEPASTPLELLKQLAQSILPFAAPLLFAAFTCLFVLPLIAANRAYIHSNGFLPVIIVILVVAVAQGIAVHFVGSNNAQWVLVTLGGFFLFLLIGCFAIFGPIPTLIVFILIVALAFALMRFYMYPVEEGHVDIVYAFGKYSRTLYPGLNILMPWEKATRPLNVGEKQWVCPLQKVQLSRDEDVVLRATISYQLLPEDAHIAMTQVNQWEEILKELVVSMIQNIATTFTPDDFIPWQAGGSQSHSLTYDKAEHDELRWERVNVYLYELLRDRVAMWGVQVNWVRIRDVSVGPHGATIVETDSIFEMPTTAINNAGPTAERAAPSQRKGPKPKKSVPEPKQSEEPTQAIPVSPAASSSPATPPPLPNEEVLIDLYNQVRDGSIVHADIIRSVAVQFEEIARNPAARDTMTFDAEAAARILYQWAEKFDVPPPPTASTNTHAGAVFEDDTNANWPARRATDENLMAGG